MAGLNSNVTLGHGVVPVPGQINIPAGADEPTFSEAFAQAQTTRLNAAGRRRDGQLGPTGAAWSRPGPQGRRRQTRARYAGLASDRSRVGVAAEVCLFPAPRAQSATSRPRGRPPHCPPEAPSPSRIRASLLIDRPFADEVARASSQSANSAPVSAAVTAAQSKPRPRPMVGRRLFRRPPSKPLGRSRVALPPELPAPQCQPAHQRRRFRRSRRRPRLQLPR